MKHRKTLKELNENSKQHITTGNGVGLVVFLGFMGLSALASYKPTAPIVKERVKQVRASESYSLSSIAKDAPGVSEKMLRAVVRVESGGKQAAKRFEPAYCQFLMRKAKIRMTIRSTPNDHSRTTILAQNLSLSEKQNPRTPKKDYSIAPVCAEKFKPLATSWGVMQVMGQTAESMGVKWQELLDLETNLRVGAVHLSNCLRHEGGKLERGFACYNAGPEPSHRQYPASSVVYAKKVMKVMSNLKEA